MNNFNQKHKENNMQLYILHFSEGAEKLQVYTDGQLRDAHWNHYGDEPDYQETLHRYDVSGMEGYLALCEDIGEDADWSLWFIDGDILDFEDIDQGEA
jgi:hypothetical protein